jgi:hypothetical protein
LRLRIGDKTACVLGEPKISLIVRQQGVADLAVTEERFDFSWRGQARRWSHDDDVMTNEAESAGVNLIAWVEVMLVNA